MNILYLSYDGMTDPLGQSQVMPYLFGLRKLGHIIHLVSFEKPERVQLQNEIKTLLDTNGIVWHPMVYHKSPAVVSTVFDIYKLKQKIKQLYKAFGFDIVHCRSYIAAIAGLYLKQKTGLRFIFDMRGFYADERVDGGLWPQDKAIYKLVFQYFKLIEKKLLINADAIISLTHSAEKIMQDWQLKVQPLPIAVIPCCADLNHFNFNNNSKNSKINTLQIPDGAFVLCYLGAIGTWYLLNEMLIFFKELCKQKPNAIFLFITTEDSNTITRAALKIGIEPGQLRITSATRKQVPCYLQLAHVAIFFIKPTFSKKASSPTKQAELMGMGLPIICNAGVGDTDYIVSQTKCGVALQTLDAETFYQTAKDISLLTQINKSMIRQGALQFFDLKQGISLYNNVYENLSSTHHS